MAASIALAWVPFAATVETGSAAAAENTPPTFVEGSETRRFVGEETVAGGIFGTPVSATDAEEDAILYGLGGSDAGYFTIDAATGQLRTAATTTLAYETRNSYAVEVSAGDGRGGVATVAVSIHVLDSLVTVPVQPAVRRNVRVTANKSQIDEGQSVTFRIQASDAAPAGGLRIFYSLKQLAADGDTDGVDFRPLPQFNTHHQDSLTIAEGETSASVTYRTVADDFEETDVSLILDIGLSSHNSFGGQRCSHILSLNIQTITSRPTDCWASVDVRDMGDLEPPEPVPFTRFASIFPGHVLEYTGSNVQVTSPGDPIKFTVSLNVPAPPGGTVVYYGMNEKASDVSPQIVQHPSFDRRSVTIPEGQTEAFVAIPTSNRDSVAEDCEEDGQVGIGCIRVSILTASYVPVGDRYYYPYVHHPAPSRHTIKTIIPRVVTITADRSPITEGQTATFTVRLSQGAPPGRPVDVVVALNQVGDFAKTLPRQATVTRTLRMPAGVVEAQVDVTTRNDAVVEDDGKIVAQVRDTDAYAVGNPGEAEVVVRDDDEPTVTIAAAATPIDEGGTARFTVTLSQAAPAAGMAVVVGVSQEGEFATAALPEDRTVTVTGGATAATVEVATSDDAVVEDDGKIVAQVRDTDAYAVGNPGEAEVVVRDDDEPTVTIAAAATPIDEGETARFTVTLSRAAPAAGLEVEVGLSQEGEFATAALPGDRTVTVTGGATAATVEVATSDDAVVEDDGKIVAQVRDTDAYAVGDPGEAEVVVRDDDMFTVTIAADATPIDEGGTARFTVTLSQAAPAAGMAVVVGVSQEGEFATAALPGDRTVTVTGGATTATVEVATSDDAVVEDDGKIVAQVRDTDAYAVGNPGEAEVVVRDDDMFTVTIAADATPIDEGGTARFTVTLSQAAPAAGMAVVVGVSQEGEFATAALPGDRTVTVTGGATAATVEVATSDDAVVEDDGKIVAQVRDIDAYAVGNPGKAEVAVRDDDEPTVTIAADATPIDEGGTARFTVTLSQAAPAAGMAVVVGVSQEGEFATATLPEDRTVTVTGGATVATVEVATSDDAVVEDDGKIVAQVRDTDAYAVGNPGEAEVVVRDDDEPTVTITAAATPIDEGETARFTVTLSRAAPAAGLEVEVGLSQEGEFATVKLPEIRIVTVNGGDMAAKLEVATSDDAVVEDDGKIMARVGRVVAYAVGNPGEAEVAVRDGTPTSAGPAATILKQVAPRFGRSIASIMTKTIDCERYSRFQENRGTIGGVDVQPRAPAEEAPSAIRLWNPDGRRDGFGMSAEQVLRNSSFALGSGDRDDGNGMAYWGETSVAGFSGTADLLSMRGTVVSGVGGIERMENDLRSGIAIARSIGTIEYSLSPVGSGEVRSSLTSVHPYLCWFPGGDTSLWGMVGAGWGDASLTGAVNVDRLDTSLGMVAGGMTMKLRSNANHALLLKLSAFGVSMRSSELGALPRIEGDVASVRSIVESSWARRLESGARLRFSLEAGGRYDMGDAERGQGLMLGTRLQYAGRQDRGVTVDVSGHRLAMHTASGFRHWSGKLRLRYAPRDEGPDRSLELVLGRGVPRDAARRYLETDVLAPAEPETTPNANTSVGLYARHANPVLAGNGTLRLRGGVAWRRRNSFAYSAGLGLNLGDRLELTLDGVYQGRRHGGSGVNLRVRSSW